MGIESEWKNRGIRVGKLPCGPLDKISDVPGVTVGHCTLSDGEVQTGVTALLPHPGDIFHDKVMAASHVINGFGKTTGLVQIEELGTLETPILFTNTLSVGTVETALVKYMLDRNPDICETTGSVNPVVCECNDSGLNDIRGLHVTEENVWAALADCRADFAEGAVGAGRGMRCHGLKGGIGSASRVVELDGKPYTIGALVLSNHAVFDDLVVAGTPIQTLLDASIPPHEDKGSIITVLATDIPLSERQLRRLCHRALVGLSRTGSTTACSGSPPSRWKGCSPTPRLPHTMCVWRASPRPWPRPSMARAMWWMSTSTAVPTSWTAPTARLWPKRPGRWRPWAAA